MTETELHELIADCPTLYHMAEKGSWPSIAMQGLLSTTALLDLYGVPGEVRQKIEAGHRPTSVHVGNSQKRFAVIRDQIPMSDSGLQRCLPSSMAPADWYRLLNGKVFFWLTRDRLNRLMGAAAYRNASHDVLEVDTARLIAAHKKSIWLCPMNSGCTKPVPHPRDMHTFRRIEDYPYSTWRRKRPRGERVVELAVDYSVPDIVRFVQRVTEMKGATEIATIYKG